MKNLLKPEYYGQMKFVDEKLGSLEFIAFFMKSGYFWNSVSEITCSRMIHCTTNYYGSLNFEENTTTTKIVCFLVLYPICHIFHARKFLIFLHLDNVICQMVLDNLLKHSDIFSQNYHKMLRKETCCIFQVITLKEITVGVSKTNVISPFLWNFANHCSIFH